MFNPEFRNYFSIKTIHFLFRLVLKFRFLNSSINLQQKLHLNASEKPKPDVDSGLIFLIRIECGTRRPIETKYQINLGNFNVSVEITLGRVPILSQISNI